MNDRDFKDLLAAWLEHRELPADRQAELIHRLESDDEFRKEFAEEIQMQGMTRATQTAEPRWLLLEELLEHNETESASHDLAAFEERVAREISRVEISAFAGGWLRWLAAGFAVIAIWAGSMIVAFQHGQNTTVAELPETTVIKGGDEDATTANGSAAPVAILSRSANARWKVATLQNGSMLSRGRLAIEDGLAQVDFIGGAQVILRGPAELDLRSPGEAKLIRGRATWRVSEQAQGFRLSADGLDIVNAAGVFGLNIDSNGSAELHAINGNLSVRDSAGDARELIEATAIRLADQSFQPATYKPDFFPNLNELKRLEQQAIASRSVDWYDHSLRWSAEPETLLYYTFMSDVYQEQNVENLARKADKMSHGIVIGSRWAEGRWPWKKALEFRKRTDRVLLGLPGEHSQMTLATWIRVDAFTQSKNVLMRSKQPERWTVNGDGQVHDNPDHLPERGELRWELDRTGVISFKVATGASAPGERWDIAATPRVIKDSQLGQWGLLTTTYDAGDGAVVHYWNGKPVSKSIMTDAAPLAFEFLELGNPNLSNGEMKDGNRYGFFGAMGELLISRRILNEKEVAEFYLAGKPAS